MSVCSSESVDSSDNEGNNTPCGRNRDVESVPEATPVLAEAFPTCRSVVKPLLRLAWPVAMASLCMALLPTVSLVFVGQLSQNALSAGGLAYSYTNVAGYSLILGLLSGLDSLGSQAFGSGNHARVGVLHQRSLIVTFVALIPVGLLWWYAEPLLVLARQPVEVAAMAARYTHRSIPGLFGFGVFEATRRFLQVQGVVMPMLYTSLAVNMLHPLWNWLLITKFGWGFDGAPWATVLSQSLMAFLLLTYMFFRPVHVAGTWSGVCRDAVKDIGEYLRFGVPGALVLCLEWWLFEIVGFMAGSMGSVPLAVNNIAAGVVQLVFNVPFGVSVAGATMLGNLLGGGESSGAKRVTTVMLSLSTAFALIYAVAIAVCRGVLPKVFTSDSAVVSVSDLVLPLVAVYVLLDAFQCNVQGVLRGSGRQGVGVVVALIGFYFVTLPVAYVFAFTCGFGLPGLWGGMCLGYAVISAMYVFFVCRLNWDSVVKTALLLARVPAVVDVPVAVVVEHTPHDVPVAVELPEAVVVLDPVELIRTPAL